MLPDKMFLWPYKGIDLQAAIDELTPALCVSDLDKYVECPSGNLAEFMALQCRVWNVNPWWLMVCAQREQSGLARGDWNDKREAAWLGVVGQDVGRTARPGYYGVYTQILRACEITAWLLGVEPATKWPEYWRTRKEAPRFQVGKTIKIERDGKQVDYLPLSRGEFMQLMYTPHYGVLALNEGLARRWVPQKYFS